MDYRSREAVHIGDLFMQSQMAHIKEDVDGERVTVGYRNRATGAQYLRTTRDRLIRIDGASTDSAQFNLLSRDCKRFEPWEPGWSAGERIDLRRPFLRGDLIPPQTTWQWVLHDVASRVAMFSFGALAGRGLFDIVHYATHHALHAVAASTIVSAGAAGYAVNEHIHQQAHYGAPHVPDHDAHAFEPPHGHHFDPHFVAGSPEEPVTAPNGCVLDGTPESAGAAMLPGPCSNKVTWVAFDVHDEHGVSGAHTPISDSSDDPAPFTSVDYTGRVTHGIHHPMTMVEKVALGAGVGIMGTAGYVVARDMTTNDYRHIQRDVNRRLDAEQEPHNRSGFGMRPIQR